MITGAGNLKARYVIHTVGPIWGGGEQQESTDLARAYRHSLEVAIVHDCQSIAFPSLSTGAYGYPVEQAAQTALQTVIAFLEAEHQPLLVRFILFDAATYEVFAAQLETDRSER